MRLGVRVAFGPLLRVVVPLAVLIGLYGCAGKPMLARYADQSRFWLADPEFLSAFSCSDQGLEQASNDARVQVAQQVQARLVSQWESVTEALVGPRGDASRTAMQARIAISTEFEDADLIRVQQDSIWSEGRFTCVVAVLRRSDALARSAARWAGLMARFDAIETNVRKAIREDCAGCLAVVFPEAMGVVADLARVNTRWRTFSGEDRSDFDRVVAGRRQLLVAAAGFRESTRVSVAVTPGGAGVPGDIESRLQRLVAKMGLRLVGGPAGSGAGVSGSREVRLHVVPRTDCRREFLGTSCRAGIVFRVLGETTDAGVASFDVTLPQAGSHPADGAKAAAAVWAGLDDSILEQGLRETLARVVPAAW